MFFFVIIVTEFAFEAELNADDVAVCMSPASW